MEGIRGLNMKKIIFTLLVITLVLSVSCSLNEEASNGIDTSDWTEETHGSTTAPNYDVVFPENEVKRFDLVIDPDDWQDMLDDMKEKYGTFGSDSGGGGGGAPGGPGPGGGGDVIDLGEDPIYVPCSLFFEGKEWYRVGVRFKGNSSLKQSWGSGIWKLALKLDFNEFEDDYPEILGQRFYGFRQLSLASNFNDTSFIRERVVPEIFRAMGVRAPHTAYYRVYINYGEGLIYFGLYTAVEVVDDTVLGDQFGNNSGNCYKPEGTGATFAANTFNQDYFEKQNNKEAADWSDIQALFEALHSSDRTANHEEWKNHLESVFNVDGFIRWLAVNTVIQNWDTYGKMSHNYYLYNDPDGPGLTWIPWDNNEALRDGRQGEALTLALTEVGSNWPLIRYLMDDEAYNDLYALYVDEVINTAFVPSVMAERYNELHDLIQPYVTGSEGEKSGYTFLSSYSEFDQGLTTLISHVSARKTSVENYLASRQ